MSFQATVKFKEDNETYLTLTTNHKEYAHDMVIDAIFNMMALLCMGDHKFDDDVIDHIIRRAEELRDCPHGIDTTPSKNSEHVMDAANYLTCK